MKILMVCKGNICRSPLAEGILRELSIKNELNWVVDSAAIKPFHIGKAPDLRAIYTAEKHHIDISGHKCRLITTEDFDDFDIIYAMSQDIFDFMKGIAPKNRYDKLKLLMSEVDSHKAQDVPDPFYGEQKDFDNAYDLIVMACEQIVKKYIKSLR